MSISEEQELLLSQLVDGELSADQANKVLADALANPDVGKKLSAMIQLRQAMDPWRKQEPPKAIVALTPAQPVSGAPHFRRRLLSLATAAVLGGILVAGGFYLGNRHGNTSLTLPSGNSPMVIVTPEERGEIARAFSLHESVAGPLSWYAADDSTIQVAPARKGEVMRQPIAVVLRLRRDMPCANLTLTPPKTYVIVCRNSDAATIELPASAGEKAVRLRLLPTATNGQVSLQYAIAADGSDRGPDEAAMAGRRNVGLGQTALGQLAMNDCLVDVDASAWVIPDQAKP